MIALSSAYLRQPFSRHLDQGVHRASTHAHAGKDCLIYFPDGGEVSVDLTAFAGTVQVEWFNPRLGQASRGGTASGGARCTFKAQKNSLP